MNNVWAHLRPLVFMSIAILTILFLSRLVLVFMWWSRVISVDALAMVFVQGLRFDLVLLGYIVTPLSLLFPILTTTTFFIPLWKKALGIYFSLVIVLVAFMELATPEFARQFDARPNILFFEYIAHPKEIMSTLWGAYRLQLIAGLSLVVFLGFTVHRKFTSLMYTVQPVKPAISLILATGLLLGGVMSARSTLDHRPVNPSTVARTTDSLVNELALGSTYTVAYAAYEMRYEDRGGIRYGDITDEKALRVVREGMQAHESSFHSPNTTWHGGAQETKSPPKNLVIILEESLGAEFVGSLGGRDLTPNLDKLREQGWSFDQLYATGTRSVRGIEAITTGFLPTASRSVVKLSKSQKDFFTLGWLLQNQGYETSFIYGGESHFDNMRRFFINNGFQTIVDQNDYSDPVFTGSWGVSDEDLFEKAHQIFQRQQGKLFFSLVFTSSNHTPFEFPDGRIELYDAEKQTVNNAVKYADYALGTFFEKARQSSYWDNTVFLVVSDHNSRVYGAERVPVKRFHIPGVIVGNGIEPKHISTVASQIDLPPTLLSLIGVSASNPMVGRDFTRLQKDAPGRAIMQFNSLQAYMEGDQVVVLQKGVAPTGFTYDGNKLINPVVPSERLLELALGHVTWASLAYKRGDYNVSHAPLEAPGTWALKDQRNHQ